MARPKKNTQQNQEEIKSASKVSRKITTYDDLIKKINSDINTIYTIKSTTSKQVLEAWKKTWIAKGGCDKCLGTGQVVVWDTMDSASGCYAEYGPCPSSNCTYETRNKSGIDISYYGKYHPSINFEKQRNDFLNPLVNHLDNKLSELKAKVLDLDHENRLFLGKIVIVTKGRKVPTGIIGKIFYKKEGLYGLTLGIKQIVDGKDEVHWVYAQNVDIIKEDESDLTGLVFA